MDLISGREFGRRISAEVWSENGGFWGGFWPDVHMMRKRGLGGTAESMIPTPGVWEGRARSGLNLNFPYSSPDMTLISTESSLVRNSVHGSGQKSRLG